MLQIKEIKEQRIEIKQQIKELNNLISKIYSN